MGRRISPGSPAFSTLRNTSAFGEKHCISSNCITGNRLTSNGKGIIISNLF